MRRYSRKPRRYVKKRRYYRRRPATVYKRRYSRIRYRPAQALSDYRKFYTVYTENFAAAASGTKSFYVNSLNDPMGTASAYRPACYEEYKALYYKYNVISGYYVINVVPYQTSVNNIQMCFWFNTQAAFPTTFEDALAQRGAKLIAIGNDDASKKMIIKFSIRHYMRREPLSDKEAIFDSDPNRLLRLNLWVISVGANYAFTLMVRSCQRTVLYGAEEQDLDGGS